MRRKVDFSKLISVADLVEQAPAFKIGTVREWLFHRKSNMLSSAVLKIDENVWLDIDRFNVWLSIDKETVSDFRNLRTKKQLLEACHIKAGKLEDWLRKRHWNGLDEAVIKKGEKRLYIDIFKFNCWLYDQNRNDDFGMLELGER